MSSRGAAIVAHDEARATRDLSMPLSANEDSSDDEVLDVVQLGGHHSMVIKRTEVPFSSTSIPPLELRSLTLWAPGTCPRQPEQCTAGIVDRTGASQNTIIEIFDLCS